jgi:hypothetical protein
MKAKKQETRKSCRASAKAATAVAENLVPHTGRTRWCACACGGVRVYGPSLYGPFLFDDQYPPFSLPNFAVDSLRAWISGVRPLLMFSYWVNYQLSGFRRLPITPSTCSSIRELHPVVSHRAQSSEFAEVGAARDVLAVFAGALFCCTPEFESVGYVASRLENFGILFFYGAFAVYLYLGARQRSPGWAACY